MRKLLDFAGLSTENPDSVQSKIQQEKTINEFEKGLNKQMNAVQKFTAMKIFDRFLKKQQSHDQECQAFSLEELTYTEQKKLDQLKARFDSVSFQKSQLQNMVEKHIETIKLLNKTKEVAEQKLQSQINILQDQLQESNDEITRLKGVIHMLEIKNMIAEDKIQDLQIAADEKKEIQVELQSLRKKYDELEEKYDILERQQSEHLSEEETEQVQNKGSQSNLEHSRSKASDIRKPSDAQRSPIKRQQQRKMTKDQSVNVIQMPTFTEANEISEKSEQNYYFDKYDKQGKDTPGGNSLNFSSNRNKEVFDIDKQKKHSTSRKGSNYISKENLIIEKKSVISEKDEENEKHEEKKEKLVKSRNAHFDQISQGMTLSLEADLQDIKVTIVQNEKQTGSQNSIIKQSSSKISQLKEAQEQKTLNPSKKSTFKNNEDKSQQPATQSLNAQQKQLNQSSIDNNQVQNSKQADKEQKVVINNNQNQEEQKVRANSEIPGVKSNMQQRRQSLFKKEIDAKKFEPVQRQMEKTFDNLKPVKRIKEAVSNDPKREQNDMRQQNPNPYQNMTQIIESESQLLKSANIKTRNPEQSSFIDNNQQTLYASNFKLSIASKKSSQIAISHKLDSPNHKQTIAASTQTDNQSFMDSIIEVIKKQIMDQLEQEKEKLTNKEYELLMQKARELIIQIKSKLGTGGDVFFRAGVFLAQSQQPIINDLDKQMMSVSKMENKASEKIEEYVKIRVQKRVGGAGDFQKYSEKKRKSHDYRQDLGINSRLFK